MKYEKWKRNLNSEWPLENPWVFMCFFDYNSHYSWPFVMWPRLLPTKIQNIWTARPSLSLLQDKTECKWKPQAAPAIQIHILAVNPWIWPLPMTHLSELFIWPCTPLGFLLSLIRTDMHEVQQSKADKPDSVPQEGLLHITNLIQRIPHAGRSRDHVGWFFNNWRAPRR